MAAIPVAGRYCQTYKSRDGMEFALFWHEKLKRQEMEIMRKNSGFTFTELMVTIAIIAILSSLAIPNFIAWLPNYRLQSGAEDVQSTLQLARITAIKENATVRVKFNTANETYQAFVPEKPPEPERTIRTGRMPAGVDIFSADFGGDVFVEFDNQGTAKDNTDGKAQLRNNSGRTKTIWVSITGNSRID
jgi:prepilin-type N-terminal cleavage/methylation domain-containing protein